MSNLTELLTDCDALGIRLLAGDSDGLVVDAPEGALTPELVERIKAHKGELLATLRPKADVPNIDPTDATSLWQAALDRVEGDPLFPAEVMAGLRDANVHWAPSEAVPEPKGNVEAGQFDADGWPMNSIDAHKVDACDKCGSLELWQSVTGRWRCPMCDPQAMTTEELKEKALRLQNDRPG